VPERRGRPGCHRQIVRAHLLQERHQPRRAGDTGAGAGGQASEGRRDRAGHGRGNGEDTAHGRGRDVQAAAAVHNGDFDRRRAHTAFEEEDGEGDTVE